MNKWQTSYVRYAASEVAQARSWDAEACRRSLQNVDAGKHPVLKQNALLESVKMSIIEAPAEIALPVKQDR